MSELPDYLQGDDDDDDWPGMIEIEVPRDTGKPSVETIKVAPLLKITPLAEALSRETKREFGIKGIWERKALVSMFGETGAGKTFQALDMAMAIANDRPWCGRKVHPGGVVYIAGEDASGVIMRLTAYCEVHPEAKEAAFGIIEHPLDLPDNRAVNALLEAAGAMFGKATEVVVIDTGDSCFGTADDSKPVDMRRFVDACKGIRDYLECTVLILMHPGHENADRERGGSNFKAAMDARFRVRPQGDDDQVLEHIKMKNGPLCEPMVFERRIVELGYDDDGDPITSCVLHHKADAEVTPAERKRGPSKQSRAVIDALDAATNAAGKDAIEVFDNATIEAEDFLTPLTRVVAVEEWRNEAYRRVLHDHKAEARKKAFARAREDLAANKWTQELDGYAYRVARRHG
jgi:hypothetical protein